MGIRDPIRISSVGVSSLSLPSTKPKWEKRTKRRKSGCTPLSADLAMGTTRGLLFLLLVSAASSQTILQRLPEGAADGRSDGGGGDGLWCDSWRLSVETNNAGAWAVVPGRCAGFVEGYMNGEQYASDSVVVAGDALHFADTVRIADHGKDAWVFDVDETLLSNLPYYAAHAYGSELFNETSWNEWVDEAKAPALPASLRLYEELQGLGYQLVLLTGRSEGQRNATEKNLVLAGYHSWERLILRASSDIGKPAQVYKSERRGELEAEGYRIHGNSGDQWTDLLGFSVAVRSFKLPNPMYYVG